ncbi:MAG: methyltransferase [Candidatus Omnitrophota bacterium]
MVAEKVKRYNPDFILFYPDTPDFHAEKTAEPLLIEFQRSIYKLGIPVRDARMPFEYQGNLFIYTEDNNKNSFKKETAALKKAFKGSRPYNNAFVFTHQQPWFEEDIEWGKAISFLAENKVRNIFGPNLQYLTLKDNDGRHILSRSLPCYLKRYPQSPCLHFLVVDVDKGSASVEFVPVGGEVMPSFSTLEVDSPGRQEERMKSQGYTGPLKMIYLDPSRIVRAMKIRPGMDILDIGAGTGIFSFRFAEALKGRGTVFATDVDPDMIGRIEEKLQNNEHKNIFPVMVRPEGLDPFYKEHTFDIIFISEVYQYLRDPEEYFRGLWSSLKDAGHLYMINHMDGVQFVQLEFGNFKDVVRSLSLVSNGFPIFRRLSQETRDFIRGWKGEDVPSDIRIRITQEFNGMLSDRWLFNDLMDHYSKEEITMGETGGCVPKQFSALPFGLHRDKWLIVFLDAAGTFDLDIKELIYTAKIRLNVLNRILLTRAIGVVYRPEFLYEGEGNIISTLKAAGYEFVRSYDFPNYWFFLEFKKKL